MVCVEYCAGRGEALKKRVDLSGVCVDGGMFITLVFSRWYIDVIKKKRSIDFAFVFTAVA